MLKQKASAYTVIRTNNYGFHDFLNLWNLVKLVKRQKQAEATQAKARRTAPRKKKSLKAKRKQPR